MLAIDRNMPARAERKEAERARAVEDARPRQFFVTRRFDVGKLNPWQRAWYTFLCRRLRGDWRVPPPFVPLSRGGLFTFEEADAKCRTPDDQIHVLPLGWVYGGEEVDAEEVCCPRDPEDEKAYRALKAKYGFARPPAAAPHDAQGEGDISAALASLPPETRDEVRLLLKSLHELGRE